MYSPTRPRPARAATRARFSLRALADLLLRVVEADEPESEALGDVGAQPPARQRRQVMGRDAGDGQRGIVGRRQKIGAAPLEPQDAHAEDVGAGQRLAKAVGHGAEILAHHHAGAALALQRDMADEIVEGIGEIGALGGLRPVGHDEEARQAHRVIDAQHAGVTHVGAEQRAKTAPAVARRSDGVGRRKIPDLPLRRERIGRRADADAKREFPGARPALRAVGRRADGEIAIEPDLQPGGFGARRGAGELPVGEPLREQGEGDPFGVLARFAFQRRGLGVAQRLRPTAPLFAFSLLRDRLENREAPERLAALGDEARVVGEKRIVRTIRARPLEGGKARLERGALDRPHRVVIDRRAARRGADRVGLRGERRLECVVARQAAIVENVDMDGIEKAPVGGMVGAASRAIAVRTSRAAD